MAEVLITLGIIGVVAAMTLPTLVNSYQKQVTVNKLRKTLTIINLVLQNSRRENGEVEDWIPYNQIGIQQYLEKYWLQYFQEPKLCTSYQVCSYKSNKPYKNPNGSSYGHTFYIANKRIPFLTVDGILITIAPETTGTLLLNVDINGAAGPNIVGRDLFYLEYDSTKKAIYPYGYYVTDEELASICSPTNGNCCAAKIARDGWTIKEDYPW